MASVLIRNLRDDVHKALKERAAAHGRSTEAEIRAILEEAVLPNSPRPTVPLFTSGKPKLAQSDDALDGFGEV